MEEISLAIWGYIKYTKILQTIASECIVLSCTLGFLSPTINSCYKLDVDPRRKPVNALDGPNMISLKFDTHNSKMRSDVITLAQSFSRSVGLTFCLFVSSFTCTMDPGRSLSFCILYFRDKSPHCTDNYHSPHLFCVLSWKTWRRCWMRNPCFKLFLTYGRILCLQKLYINQNFDGTNVGFYDTPV